MSTQEDNEIHAICEKEQCGYDGIVIPKARKGLAFKAIVVGIFMPVAVPIILPMIDRLIFGNPFASSSDSDFYIGLIIGLIIVVLGIAMMFYKELVCPACTEGTMFDIYEDKGAVLYARKYPSSPQY